MGRKALFFDIDGTLVSEITGVMPESAERAIARTRKAGNLVFINTGRTMGSMKAVLPSLEADGYLCGCGTQLWLNGKVIYQKSVPHERGLAIKKAIGDFDLDGVLEGADNCYFRKGYSRIPLIRDLKKAMEDHGNASPSGWDDDDYEFDKFCVSADEKSDREGFFAFLAPDFQVIDRGGDFYECVPRGHDKATAIDRILKELGMSREDAWVFGDSSNDLACFQYAQNAVLMGKHDKVLEEYATFVTKTVEEDGIEYAMETLGLL